MTVQARLLVLGASFVVCLAVADARHPVPGDMSADLAAKVAAISAAAERGDLEALYAPRQYAPLWVDGSGLPNHAAREALALIRDAHAEGLNPTDYSVPCPAPLVQVARAAVAPVKAAAFDVGMSRALLRYLRDLHLGRIDPTTLGFRFARPDHSHDFHALLRSAIADDRVAAVARELWPQSPQYVRLRAALRIFRDLAADRSVVAAPRTADAVRPGDLYAGAAALRHQLIALGDLPADVPPPADTIYAGPLVEAVRRFQLRHGLDPDGVIGRNTQAALDVPLAARAQQIEGAMERLRWLPDLGGERVVTVNIPTFELRGWNVLGAAERPDVASKVIVGRAIATQTPVFSTVLRSVIFRPYWNVPRSIVVNETLPAIARRPGYLAANDMEIIDPAGRSVPETAGSLARVLTGQYGIRQRPGPSNALGLVKFDFPNRYDVYMHSTPAPALFSRSRRDFSHGCVRVEDAVALAEWVLAGQTDWPRERIIAAMNGDRTVHVALARPVHVVMFYLTAVGRDDGAVRFAPDIYGHDARLQRALSQRRDAAYSPARDASAGSPQ